MFKKSKIVSILSAAAMISAVLSVFPVSAGTYTKQFGDFEYIQTPNKGYVEIESYKGTDTVVEIPSEINGYTVTKVADRGLSNNKNVEKLILPDTVTEIGKNSISYNDSLKEIVFPSSLETVGYASIAYNKALTSVTFPEGVKNISNNVLSFCDVLEEVSVPSTVMYIGEGLASFCYKTKAFEVDDANNYYCDADGVIYTKDMTEIVRYPSDLSANEYTLPDSVTSIAESAFCSVGHLEKVNIPDTVTVIGERAFQLCAHLKSIRLPHELKEIPSACLGSLYYLEELYIPKTVKKIANAACTFFETIPTIYYEGTEEEWKEISVEGYNPGFEEAKIVYNYDYNAEKQTVPGDVNADGTFGVADVMTFKRWLLGISGVTLADPKAADFFEDDKLNSLDLTLMKKAFLDKRKDEAVVIAKGYRGAMTQYGYQSQDYASYVTSGDIANYPKIAAAYEKVAAKADALKDKEMHEWGSMTVFDYGMDELYLPNKDGEDILLCEVGGRCGWLDDPDVQELVKLLMVNSLFSDESFLWYYINDFKSNDPPEEERAPLTDGLTGKTFKYNNIRYGDKFTISFGDNGRFEYCETELPRYKGEGHWTIYGDTLILEEYPKFCCFKIKDNHLIYDAGASDGFNTVTPDDGDRFILYSDD